MKEYNRIIWFIIYSLGLFIGWFIIYDLWLNYFDTLLSLMLANSGAWLLKIAGYKSQTINAMILIDGIEMVHVGSSCNGMVMMAIFAGFIIAFPSQTSNKIIFILWGIFGINLLNVLRIAALTLNVLYSKDTIEFNHRYTFTIIIYTFIFGLWMIWVKKLPPKKSFTHTNSHQQFAN